MGKLLFQNFLKFQTAVYRKCNVETSPTHLYLLLYLFDLQMTPKSCKYVDQKTQDIFLANMKIHVHVSLWKFRRCGNTFGHASVASVRLKEVWRPSNSSITFCSFRMADISMSSPSEGECLSFTLSKS